MDLNINSKVAVVTGASHGIGKAIAIELAKEGCFLAICARGERYNLTDVKNTISVIGQSYANPDCYAEVADMSNRGHRLKFIANVIHKFGRIDILINNVGGGSSWGNSEHFHMTPYKTYQEVMDINYFSMVELTNFALPTMIKNKFGRVITISSLFGKENGGMPWFQAAKSAQISYMKAMSASPEYAKANITFNTMCPGYLDIPDKKIDDCFIDKIPAGRFGVPEEVAPAVALLCSPKSGYTNGSCITIDGGYSNSF